MSESTNKTNFYDELDLRYIEIGIAMTRIDRINPGSVPFCIPILTPELNTSTMQDSKIVQRSKSNLDNENPDAIEVSDIETSNYVYITIPQELCAQPEAEYYVEGVIHLQGYSDTYSGLAGSGSVIEGGSINVSGTLSSFLARDTNVLQGSKLFITPTEDWRYIPQYSKWALIFLGGDINKPRVLCRLPDDYVQNEKQG